MEKTCVVIVGAGPVGLITAYLLARQKIECIVLERREAVTKHPKAHTLNPATLEIFRQAGIDVAYIRQHAASARDAGAVRLVYGLAGTEVGCVPYERQDDEVLSVTAEPLVNWPQPELERLLEKAVTEAGVAQIRRGCQVDAVDIMDTEECGCVVSWSRTGADAAAEKHSIQAEFVIGADGINSIVRDKTAGIEFESLGPGHAYQSIVCEGSLRSLIPPGREAMLYFCFHPEHYSEFIAYDLDSCFVHVTPTTDPTSAGGQSEAPSIEACLPGLQYSEVLRTIWETAPSVASSYSDEKHRVFLVGDAAHRLPPQGGLGLNTGIGDAHNLVWKLASVLQGQGTRHLLASYTRERRPVALTNLDYSKASETAFYSVGDPAFYSVSTTLVDLAVQYQEAIAQAPDLTMDAFLQRPANSAAAAEAAAEAGKHFDSLALQLGFIYDDPSSTKALLDNPTVYVPRACPGARLPHGIISDGRSLLDLVPYDRFTLLHYDNPAFASCDWAIDVASLGLPQSWFDVVPEVKRRKGIIVRPDHRVLLLVDSLNQADNAVKEFLDKGKSLEN